MKNICCYWLLLFPIVVFAQNEHLKHDYIWLTGYDSNPNQLEFGGTVIDFNEDPIDVYYEYRDFDFEISNTTMCDENGELIFSCNNNIVANRLNELMENGGGLNPEPSIDQNRITMATLALPSPTNDSIYLLLHQELTWVGDLDGNWAAALSLKKTMIDMKYSSNPSISDLGRVIEKNISIIDDTLAYGRITATRHANGRDWWVLQQQYSTNKFYRFLLSPEGFIEQEPQIIGDNQLYNAHGVGQSIFSPNGSQYITANLWDFNFDAQIDFYDFDRCTGLLSNFERITLENPSGWGGVAISPNSKYAYFSFQTDYYQIDLDESPKQMNLIQEYSDTTSTAFIGQLAPNGKIYFCAAGGQREMHIIHNPDEEGTACNIEQGGLSLPTYNNGTIPNHPNYRLGRLIGSPCDTLMWGEDTTSVSNLSSPVEDISLSVSPNPASHEITLSYKMLGNPSDYKIYLYNSVGMRVMSKTCNSPLSMKLNINNLPEGIYWLNFVGGENVNISEKVLIAR